MRCYFSQLNLQKFLKTCNKIIYKIFRVEKDNNTEGPIKSLEKNVDQVRSFINLIQDANKSQEIQKDKIADLERQLQIKETFIKDFKENRV